MDEETESGQLGIRLDPQVVSEFKKNCAAAGRSHPSVLKELVKSCNALFREKKDPAWPFRVVDATESVGVGPQPTMEEIRIHRERVKQLDRIEALVVELTKGVVPPTPEQRTGEIPKTASIDPRTAKQQRRPSSSRKSQNS